MLIIWVSSFLFCLAVYSCLNNWNGYSYFEHFNREQWKRCFWLFVFAPVVFPFCFIILLCLIADKVKR